MLEQVPLYVNIVFILTTFLTVWLLYRASNKNLPLIVVVIIWSAITTILSMSGFFKVTSGMPPRFALIPIIPLFLIILVFLSAKGRKFLDTLNNRTLTFLHIVRIPVEIVLWLLFLLKTLPLLMTFEGRNFDILAGISAPLIVYLGYMKNKIGKKGLLIWNFICLGLLLNIVINAIFSIPSDFQKQAFDQPNVAVLHFPLVWLPGIVVPIVLFAHLVCIRSLLKPEKNVQY